ncbi:hypothetical protein ASF91_17055 [Rhizobium sp. Leaf155]|nr:hypothetical protein ASF91_17055 [Rhizobium sp. Leaf155]
MASVKLLVADLTEMQAAQMDERQILEIICRHGFVLCRSQPVGWAAHASLIDAQENGGVIGIGSDEGDVVYDGNTWMNADKPLYCS